MASSDHYSQELSAQLGQAATRGLSHILTDRRELHSSLGDFSDTNDTRCYFPASITPATGSSDRASAKGRASNEQGTQLSATAVREI
jgi:hypothetical protein